MRSMKKDKPFMLMESAPGLVNWHPYNKLKRPGVHKLSCMQAVACGSDTVQYFQWRKGRGSFEQYHGAVVDHLGTDGTRIFRETAEVGSLLKKIRPVAGTLVKAKAALLFDWDNRWAIQDMKGLGENSKKYETICMDIWRQFQRMGIEMDIIPSDGELSGYSVIAAPMLYMLRPRTSEKLKAFVEGGGQLLATYLLGYVDMDQLCYLGGFPGDGLSELFGVISEEIDTLYPEDKNRVNFAAGTEFEKCQSCEVRDYAEILRIKDCEVLACYEKDYYAGMPAVTRKKSGQGNAYYVAARMKAEDMRPLFEKMLSDAGLKIRKLPDGVEYHVRSGKEGVYEFYLNHSAEAVVVENVTGRDLLNGSMADGELHMEGMGVSVISKIQ